MYQYIDNKTAGFTLVEMIVAVTLFAIVAITGAGAVVDLYNATNRAKSIASIMNGMNYALDGMTRTIRFATNYHCGSAETLGEPRLCGGTGPGDGEDFFAVTTPGGVTIYKLENGAIKLSTNGGSSFTSITPTEVVIEGLNFYASGVFPGGADNAQPYVVVSIKGRTTGRAVTQSPFNLQTTISQIKPDL